MGQNHLDLSQIARERIGYLLGLAKAKWVSSQELSRRYVSLARKIAMRHRIRIGNRLFCKKCDAPFIHGKTAKARLVEGKVRWICTSCGIGRTVAKTSSKN